MKFFATALALAALSASPAFAATKHHSVRMAAPDDAYAAAYQDPAAVFAGDGQYLGRDPDANVRAELRRGQMINID